MSVGLRHAQARVLRVLERVAERDMPLVGPTPDPTRQEELDALRASAERRATQFGRGALLDEAWDRVASGYASRLGDLSHDVAVFGIPVPIGAEQRASAQVAVQDLVLAAVAEDLLTVDEVASLSEAGELLLGAGVELPPGWTPPAGVDPVPGSQTRPEPRTWPRSELVGAALLVVLAAIAASLAIGNVLAGAAAGLGTAALLFLWRRSPAADEEGS